MRTSEFNHYPGCRGKDPENCQACALTTPTMIDHGDGVERMGINYAAWPLSYMDNGRQIPPRFYGFLLEELESDNKAYVDNLKSYLERHGYDIEKIRKEVRRRALETAAPKMLEILETLNKSPELLDPQAEGLRLTISELIKQINQE